MSSQPSSVPGSSVPLVLTFLIALAACQACGGGGNRSRGIVVVNAPAAGEIRRVLAHEGMEVVEGQPIAEIAVYSPAQGVSPPAPDQKEARTGITVRAAQTEIEAARTEVVRHEVEVQRLSPLVSSGQAPQGALDAERALYQRAQQRLQKAKSAAQQAQTGLVVARQQSLNSSNATPAQAEQIVTARTSAAGILSALNMAVGERVVAGQPLATIRAH